MRRIWFPDRESVISIKGSLLTCSGHKDTESKVEHFISEKCLHRNVVMVGFHVRRADYRFYRNGAYYYEDVAWLSWIRQARRAFRSNAKRFVGLISSDEDVSSWSTPLTICSAFPAEPSRTCVCFQSVTT